MALKSEKKGKKLGWKFSTNYKKSWGCLFISVLGSSGH